MEPVKVVRGRAVPLDQRDVDTDQIIPSVWLKRIERTGFAEGLFSAWRRDPEFVLNDPRYAGAPILLAGANFGCGSSREHAVWALLEYGFRAVVAPSFADIFRSNCAKAGLVAAAIPENAVARLHAAARRDPETVVTVDVAERTVSGAGERYTFALDEFARLRLLEGLDEIDLTLRHAPAIGEYESRRPRHLPAIR